MSFWVTLLLRRLAERLIFASAGPAQFVDSCLSDLFLFEGIVSFCVYQMIQVSFHITTTQLPIDFVIYWNFPEPVDYDSLHAVVRRGLFLIDRRRKLFCGSNRRRSLGRPLRYERRFLNLLFGPGLLFFRWGRGYFSLPAARSLWYSSSASLLRRFATIDSLNNSFERSGVNISTLQQRSSGFLDLFSRVFGDIFFYPLVFPFIILFYSFLSTVKRCSAILFLPSFLAK